MTEYEAWKRFRKQEAALIEYRRKLRSIELDMESIELDMMDALFRQCINDRAFKKALMAYTGHSQYGWDLACGTDGRLKKMARQIGWDHMDDLIHKVRRYYGE